MQGRIRDQIGELGLEPNWWDLMDHEKDFREGPGMSWDVADGADQVPALSWAHSLTACLCSHGFISPVVHGGN